MPAALETSIDWSLFGLAHSFYTDKGYQHVEVPWLVPRSTTSYTAPSFIRPAATAEGDLLGSGEQGLLQLALEGKLNPGAYQTTTPCFRDDLPDRLHGRHFMKLELMWLRPNHATTSIETVLTDAHEFFSRFLRVEKDVKSNSEIDLVCAKTGVELGSYGARRFPNISWVYGTGLAEPRFSIVRKQQGEFI